MGEVKDRDGTSEGPSPAIMFCLIVAGDLTLCFRPEIRLVDGFDFGVWCWMGTFFAKLMGFFLLFYSKSLNFVAVGATLQLSVFRA